MPAAVRQYHCAMPLQKNRLRKWLVSQPAPDEVLHEFVDAIAARDFERARRCLSDAQFTHRSPISTGHNPDAFVADISRVGAILDGVEPRTTFVNGNEACAIIDYITHMDKRRVTPVVHWASVNDGKITSLETFFDARAYAEMFTLERARK